MAKINYLAPFLFILLNLLCFVQNEKQEDTEWISFWDTDNGFIKEMKEHETKKRFAVEFNSTSSAYTGPLYLKIEVIPEGKFFQGIQLENQWWYGPKNNNFRIKIMSLIL